MNFKNLFFNRKKPLPSGEESYQLSAMKLRANVSAALLEMVNEFIRINGHQDLIYQQIRNHKNEIGISLRDNRTGKDFDGVVMVGDRSDPKVNFVVNSIMNALQGKELPL